GRVTAADHQQSLVFELHGIAEIMRMQNTTREPIKTGEGRHVGDGEMPDRDDDLIKGLLGTLVGSAIFDRYGELTRVGVLLNPTHGSAEYDVPGDVPFLRAALDIVEQH